MSARAAASSAPGTSSTNSSPPTRATVVAGRRAGGQALGHHAQQFVAGVVAQAVVDVLEAVQVHEHQREARAARAGDAHRLLQPLAQQRAVGEAGEVIVPRLALDALLVLAQFGDVLDRALVADQPAGIVVHRAGVLGNPDQPAVAAADLRLEAVNRAVARVIGLDECLATATDPHTAASRCR